MIKVEEAGRGDETRRWGPPFAGDESAYFLALNRNKESLTLNLKTTEGRRIARKLVMAADVVLQNFLPEQQKKFGLSAAQVHRANRRAIHCTIRGYDRESAEADLPGYDLLAQAAAGLMAITGPRDGDPTKVGVALADVLTAHYAYGAMLSALFARERTGRGAAVEISLFGSTVASLVNVAQNYLVTNREPARYGNEHPSIVPYQPFHASDRMFVLAVATDRHYALLCSEVLGDAELARDERFTTNASRVLNREAFIPLLQQRLLGEPAEVWVTRCRNVGIPAATVQNFAEIFAGSGAPFIDEVEHSTVGALRLVGSPIRIDGERAHTSSAPPLLGEHNEAILRELGYNRKEILELKARGVI